MKPAISAAAKQAAGVHAAAQRFFLVRREIDDRRRPQAQGTRGLANGTQGIVEISRT